MVFGALRRRCGLPWAVVGTDDASLGGILGGTLGLAVRESASQVTGSLKILEAMRFHLRHWNMHCTPTNSMVSIVIRRIVDLRVPGDSTLLSTYSEDTCIGTTCPR